MSSQIQVRQRLSRWGWQRLQRIGVLMGLSLSFWGIQALWGIQSPSVIAPVRAEDATTQRMAALKQTTQRWIEINVGTQRLIAWEGNTPVYAVIVSTGTDETPTVTGSFAVQTKLRVTRMQGEGYDVPDVPFTMYYHRGYAIHGAYWHNRFGTPMSHGCVNVAVNHAEWIYNWASVGTPIVVHF